MKWSRVFALSSTSRVERELYYVSLVQRSLIFSYFSTLGVANVGSKRRIYDSYEIALICHKPHYAGKKQSTVDINNMPKFILNVVSTCIKKCDVVKVKG